MTAVRKRVPSLRTHCRPCAFPEQRPKKSIDIRKSTLATAAVRLYAWILKHPDPEAQQSFAAHTYETGDNSQRYALAARCAEIIVAGECPLFEFIDKSTPEASIIPRRDPPPLKLVK